MRVLITTDVAGGVWSYTEDLTDALVERGHTVALVMLGGEPGAAQRVWLSEHPGITVTVLPAPLEWEPEPEPRLPASVAALRRVVEDAAPDVVHLNQFYYGAFDLGVPSLVVAHSDVVSWWRVMKGEEPPEDAWFGRYRRWVAAGLRGARVRVAPSHWIAAQIESIYGTAPVRVVYNGRSAGRFRARRHARREAVVVATGRLWDDAKGVRDLIPAAALLGGRARVVVAGPAVHPGGGEPFPVDAPELEWAGVLDTAELRLLLSQAQVYAATSRYEPFGLAPLEAALAGCALVMSDIPTFRELWDGCALFYPPGDAGALAASAAELLGDANRRGALAAAARARAVARYTPAGMAERYEVLYREAVHAATHEPVVAD